MLLNLQQAQAVERRLRRPYLAIEMAGARTFARFVLSEQCHLLDTREPFPGRLLLAGSVLGAPGVDSFLRHASAAGNKSNERAGRERPEYPGQVIERLHRASAVLALALVDSAGVGSGGGRHGPEGAPAEVFAAQLPARKN